MLNRLKSIDNTLLTVKRSYKCPGEMDEQDSIHQRHCSSEFTSVPLVYRASQFENHRFSS
jgi:hypothetical protein